MAKKSSKSPPQMPPMHERYNGKHWLLRDIIFVHVDVVNNDTYFQAHLTRVPVPGEFIYYGAYQYLVLKVFHATVDDDGRATAAYHAYIDAEWQPEDPYPSNRQKKRRPAEK